MDSNNVSEVIIGLWQIADMERNGTKVDVELATNALLKYYENGFTTFDMADHYGSAEEITGYFKKKFNLPDLKLFTKWVPTPGMINDQIAENAIHKSLKRMNSEKLDLLQFHAWNYADPNWLDALYALTRLREKGLIEHIGLTNFDHAHLNMVIESGIPIFSNQISYSLLDQRARKEMTTLCSNKKINLFAYGTVAGGFFSEKWLGKPAPMQSEQLTWSQMKYKRFIDAAGGWERYQSLLSLLCGIAQSKNCSISTVASAYIKNSSAVKSVIIGARLGESSHVEENKKIKSIVFSEDEKAAIKKMLGIGNPIAGNCGDEYRKPPFLTASGDLSHHILEFPKPYPTKILNNNKTKVFSGTPWESLAGYSRAVKKGNQIFVSGTTATHGDKIIGGNDPAAQTHFIIDKIEGVLQSVGATLDDVVRTRVFVHDISQWEPIARAHGERFAEIQPANTMVEAKLIGNGYLVEIEADAIVD